ncbi:MAG: hypothetical protein VR64_21495 [Desulfatitalea sp. BRH_c12]|nr:MAG: hypothetical protein VR64_21495 [Desulfatitalea sp. BRH_c12]
MKKQFNLILFSVCMITLSFTNSLWALELITREVMEEKVITEVDLVRKADNFIILFDGSSHTNKLVPGTNKSQIAVAKELLKQRNQWFPELGYSGGLYLLSGWTSFKTLYPVQRYEREAFGRAIDQLPDEGEGNNLLQLALFELEKVLSSLSGRTVVFLYTDGTFTGVSHPKTPVEIAKDIVQKHDVSFYIISSADDSIAKKDMLKRVASISPGSRVIPIDTFLKRPEYLSGALFTVKVSSYVKLTPKTEMAGFTTENMLFDFNGHAIRTDYEQKLALLGRFLQENTQAYVVLNGYTDGIGSKAYNLSLSEARAMSVTDYLIKNFGIAPDRIVPLWHGDLNPAADNGSAEGRQLNRRVEIAVGGL